MFRRSGNTETKEITFVLILKSLGNTEIKGNFGSMFRTWGSNEIKAGRLF